MQGPAAIDPAKLKAARQAYGADLAANEPQLVGPDGRSNAADPFDVAADGSVSFNRWTDSNNRRSAQDTFTTQDDGSKTPAWQDVPRFYNSEAQGQFDYISEALNDLQNKGLKKMRKLYARGLSAIE
jgi:hypothetical protein